MTRKTRKSQGALSKTQQEARHFALSGYIPHFYCEVLIPGLTSDQLQIEMKTKQFNIKVNISRTAKQH